MTALGVILAIVFAIIIWKVYPLLLSPFTFLVNSPVNLFIGRAVGSIIGGFILAGLLISSFRGNVQQKEAIQKAIAEVVVFDPASGETKTAPAESDPQRNLFYFDTPTLGFHLGMTISQLESLLGNNKDGLKIPDHISPGEVPGQKLVMSDSVFFSGGVYTNDNSQEYNDIVRAIFDQYNNPYGMIVYIIDDVTKYPVRVDSLDRIELTFIGGRLAAINPFEREDIVFQSLSKKYEHIPYEAHNDSPYNARLNSAVIIKVDGKECAISGIGPEGNNIINVPYIRALVKDMQLRTQKQKAHEENVRKQSADNI